MKVRGTLFLWQVGWIEEFGYTIVDFCSYGNNVGSGVWSISLHRFWQGKIWICRIHLCFCDFGRHRGNILDILLGLELQYLLRYQVTSEGWTHVCQLASLWLSNFGLVLWATFGDTWLGGKKFCKKYCLNYVTLISCLRFCLQITTWSQFSPITTWQGGQEVRTIHQICSNSKKTHAQPT